MTRPEWAECVKVLRGAFPGTFGLDAEGIRTWYALLADLDGRHVLAACIHLGRTLSAFPSVQAIRRHATAIPEDSGAAWAAVLAAVRHVGRYGDPGPFWGDPAIALAVGAVGGWLAICDSTEDQQAALRAHFHRAYMAEVQREGRDRTFAELGVAPPARPAAFLPPGPASLAQLLPPMPARLATPADTGENP